MKREAATTLALLMILTAGHVDTVSAQTAGTSLSLQPHCTESERTTCPVYSVLDATSVTTATLNTGDILDIDVILKTDQPAAVRDIRSWLKYDPKVLEARSVELTSIVTSPTPGEQSIDASQGIVKIGGSVQSLAKNTASVARVTFRVIKAGSDTTITFDQYLPSGAGRTAVNGEGVSAPGNDNYQGKLTQPPCIDVLIGCGTTERTPMLLVRPASLVVELGSAAVSSSASTASTNSNNGSTVSSAMAIASSIASSLLNSGTQNSGGASSAGTTAGGPRFNTAPSGFMLLQVQGVQITTRDNSAYLGWLGLESSELKGYNIYYGAVSGRYLQRRSVPPSYATTIIRDLEPGQTYFFAVRAFNERNEETMFSKEVSVTIGKPETATSPLLASGLTDPQAENIMSTKGGTTITGETGIGSGISVLLILSAVIGTVVAARRQFVFPS
ncbi:MAG: cohesin domain-containing protein [Candidatus Peribacteraceae bacterium]